MTCHEIGLWLLPGLRDLWARLRSGRNQSTRGRVDGGAFAIIGTGPAIVISGFCRLWQTALELLMAGIGWLALRYSGPAYRADEVFRHALPTLNAPNSGGGQIQRMKCQTVSKCEIRK